MREHKHGAPRAPRPRSRSHPVTLAIGLLLVAGVVAALVLTVRFLYSDYAWHAAAQDSASAVAEAIAKLTAIDEVVPTPVDAVAGPPGTGQVDLRGLPYANDIPPEVSRIRLTTGGGLSVVMRSGALCSGVAFSMTIPGKRPSGSFTCGEADPPAAPLGLEATPRDSFVILEWQHTPGPVEDYLVSYSSDEGASWTVVDDGVSSASQAAVRSLTNGRPYLFRVASMNLAGESVPATVAASPFTSPAPPTSVRATGGFTTIVTWTPAIQDGGRPVTGYIVDGVPEGRCLATPPATSCEMKDLPAAPEYTFTVRAVNDAGPGAPSITTSEPVAVYSVPGKPVGLTGSPGDGVVLLTWAEPLLDGNTPIIDYRVEFKLPAEDTWTSFVHPPSPDTAIAVNGLVNGTEYDFRVMAVNAAGVSAPTPSEVSVTPATVPDEAEALIEADSDESVLLAWSEPAFDGGALVTDYVVQYAAESGPWTTFDDGEGTDTQLAVTGLDNGTRYGFRVAAVNAMGTGGWSNVAKGNPFTLAGPVSKPTAVGSLTSLELSWEPPKDDGGRAITRYRIDYKPSAGPDWLPAGRVPVSQLTFTLPDLEAREAYDIRISAVTEAGAGPASPRNVDAPTLPGVIADETPPAPAGLKAVAGDRSVTLTWRESPAGPESPIVAYTVTGVPSGTCTTTKLTCVVNGLANGVEYSFTVSAANESMPGPESEPVTAKPLAYNAITGGVVSTYTRGGRTFRVHTFAANSPLVVTSGSRPFDVLVVGGGGGSVPSPDGLVGVGGGGAVRAVARNSLTPGQYAVVVGAGGAPGAAGTPTSIISFRAAAGGNAGSLTPVAMSAARTSIITGTAVSYGGPGTATSGPGVDGRGTGAGGPEANRGGNGIVVVRYELAP